MSKKIEFRYVPKTVWGAPEPKYALQPMPRFPVSEVFLHHTVTPVTDDPYADMRRVTDYGQYSDVPYTDLVHPAGLVLQGRYLNGVPALGAHTGGHNSKALGVANIGNYVGQVPNAIQLELTARVIENWVSKGWVTPIFSLRSHSDVKATACCGELLRQRIGDIYGTARKYISGVKVPPVTIVTPQRPQQPVIDRPSYPMLLVRTRNPVPNIYVIQLQKRLNQVMGSNLVEDGLFGPATERVVYDFQKKVFPKDKKQWDKKVGPKTWGKLFEDIKPHAREFPLPKGHWFGPLDNNPKSPGYIKNHSGIYNVKDRPPIRTIQQVLGLVADGGYGPLTVAAVKKYQKSRKLKQDGLVGIITWNDLFNR